MANWPSIIKVTRENYSETPPDRVTRSNMDIGPQKVRRRSSLSVRQISLRLFLTTAQLDTLDDFFLANDALVFNFVDVRTGDTKRTRFLGAPTYSFNETMWDVTVKLEFLP